MESKSGKKGLVIAIVICIIEDQVFKNGQSYAGFLCNQQLFDFFE